MTTLLGKVYKLYDSGKGFDFLVIVTNTPFHTLFKKFAIWDSRKLLNNRQQKVKLGDEVEVTYSTDSTYPELLQINTTFIESCHHCHGFYRQGLSYYDTIL